MRDMLGTKISVCNVPAAEETAHTMIEELAEEVQSKRKHQLGGPAGLMCPYLVEGQAECGDRI